MIKKYLEAFLHLWYPHICLHCGSDELQSKYPLCNICIEGLPYTDFFDIPNNPVEKIFWGRAVLTHASAALFFTKESIVQKLIFELKYKHNKKAGILLGNIMGNALKKSTYYSDIDLLIPIPISSKKLRKRGFNQAQILCEGIVQVWDKKIVSDSLLKNKDSATQTLKDRIQRSGKDGFFFYLKNSEVLKKATILLIDDVITTGATIEAACECLEQAGPANINIAAAAYTL
jgi:ComF family protein